MTLIFNKNVFMNYEVILQLYCIRFSYYCKLKKSKSICCKEKINEIKFFLTKNVAKI